MRLPRRKSPYILLGVLLLFAIYLSGHNGAPPRVSPTRTVQPVADSKPPTNTVAKAAATIAQSVVKNQPGQYPVVHYTDGDTITVSMNDKDETIRFVGVDTPETHDPRKPVQCYGPAAAAYTKNTISAAGGKVRLAADELSSNRDRYGRLLRYVYLPDGTLFNQQLIANGYAFYYPYFPFSRSDDFAAAEQTAQAGFKGLWGNCHHTPTDGGGYTSNPMAP